MRVGGAARGSRSGPRSLADQAISHNVGAQVAASAPAFLSTGALISPKPAQVREHMVGERGDVPHAVGKAKFDRHNVADAGPPMGHAIRRLQRTWLTRRAGAILPPLGS